MAMGKIHPTAVIDTDAELDSSVTVGPFTTIGPHVRIAAGTSIGSHCVIEGRTTIGTDNTIFQFNSLEPSHKTRNMRVNHANLSLAIETPFVNFAHSISVLPMTKP